MDNDTDCTHCDARATVRTCHGCGVSATLTDCGHYAQPRPIAAGRGDGSDGGHDYCEECAFDWPAPEQDDEAVRP